jgi:hypothetical protein
MLGVFVGCGLRVVRSVARFFTFEPVGLQLSVEPKSECWVWASWGDLSDGFSNDLAVYGHYECAYKTYFELSIALQLVESGELEDGIYISLPNEKGELVTTKDFKHQKKGEIEEIWECEQGRWYRAWVWGRFWYKGGGTVWYATALDGRLDECSGHFDGPGP